MPRNGNDRINHSDARHVTRDSQSKGPSIDMAFLGQTMLKVFQEHLTKMSQDNNNMPPNFRQNRRW